MATVERLKEPLAQPLELQVRSSVENLARQAVKLYRLRAIFWVVGLSVFATMAFIALDYSLHVEERGWRWLLSILWLSSQIAILWRWLPDATSFHLTPIQVAQWIERRRPELGDELSRLLAANDLPEADPRFGSLEFRRVAARICDERLAELPWQSFLQRRPTFTAGCLCLVSLLATGLLAIAARPVLSQGLARIAQPWSWTPWPRSEQLQLVDPPSMIARDSELEVHVVDMHPPFPELVELELRVDDSVANQSTNERLPMRVVQAATQAGPPVAVVTLPAITADFSIRPVGGDQQDGPWHAVRVATQPQLKEYAFTVQSPAYVHQAPTELVGQRIDVLAGSRVILRGKFDERLKSLQAREVIDARPATTGPATDPLPKGQLWPAVLSSDGFSFEMFSPKEDASLIQQDRRWQFELETHEGLQLVDSKQWMIHVTADRPPAVALAPIEPRGITRNATLAIQGSASDDLGLVDIDLTWHLPNQSPQSMRLWTSSDNNVSDNKVSNPVDNSDVDAKQPATTGDEDSNSAASRSVDISKPWSVAAASLSAGQSLTVELVARDSAGQIGRSVPQTLDVLDEAAALANLQRQQAEAFGPLRQLLDSQRRNQQSLERTLEIARQLDEVGREQVEAVDAAARLGQSIAGNLARNQDSLASQLGELSDQLARNQLGETPLAGDVARLRSQIEALVDDQLSPANQELEKAHRELRTANNRADSDQALEHLSKATQLNQKATDQFGELVESVAVAESLAEFQKQIQELASDQSAVAKQTEQLQIDTVVRGNSAQIDAQRAGIQSDQQNLARRLEELAGRLDKELHQESTEPADAESRHQIDKAHSKILESRMGDQMRQAAAMIKDSHLSDALAAQHRIEQTLGEVVAELGGNNPGGLESSSASMQDLARQLNQLANKQQQTADALKRAATGASADAKRSLTSQEKTLHEEVEQLLDQASIQANQRLQSMLNEAAKSIDQAVEQTEQDKLSDAANSAREAAEKLGAAAQTAEQRAEQLQSQVTEQQILDLRALLAGAVNRQQPLVADLEKSVAEATKLSSSNKPAVTEAATTIKAWLTTEQQLQQQLAQGRQRLQSLEAFDWLLGQCDEELLRTIASLERQRTDGETLASARAALEMMQAAEAAVSEAADQTSSPPADNAENNKQSDEQPSEKQASKLPTLASLRLLRQMQLLINQQSEQVLKSGDASDSALVRMADRQQALAEQVARLREQLKQRP